MNNKSRITRLTFVINRCGFAWVMMVAMTLAPMTRAAGTSKQVPFKASFTTEFVASPDANPCILHVQHTGTGTASHLGRMTEVTNDQVASFCTGTLSGTSVHYAANGDSVVVSFTGVLTSAIGNSVTFEGTFTVIGGTGRFNGATGGGMFNGSATFTGLNTGVGAVNYYDGTISAPGGLK